MDATDTTPLPLRVKDIRGQRYGRLIVIAFHETRKSPAGRPYSRWQCLCDCGNTIITSITSLSRKDTKSCGCRRPENATTHGMSYTKVYRQWIKMIRRCEDAAAEGFKHYGGRGITICPEWRHSIEQFLADVGMPPTEKHSIDRIDVNGNYEPSNVRWATWTEQMRNTRRNRRYQHNGMNLTLMEWSEHTGVPYGRLQGRISLGWPIEEAITLPLFSRHHLPSTTQTTSS